MHYPILIIFLFFLAGCQQVESPVDFVHTDLDHFWEAYDQITASTDSVEQAQILQQVFLDRASAGQKAMIEARNYAPEEYLAAIRNYPQFWASLRENTLKAEAFSDEIEAGVRQFTKRYPAAKPATVYFTVGVFRSPGTTTDSMVLIGSEFAFGDENVVTSEFPEQLTYVKEYHAGNPIKELPFLNIHEFVHTQQIPAPGLPLLNQCVREGVAEFLAEKVSGIISFTPSVRFGKDYPDSLRTQFAKELFNPNYGYWLWSSQPNKFGHRDLGYAVGYGIAAGYFATATDPLQAVREMIELDLTDDAAVFAFVDQSGYFSQPVADLQSAYLASRPRITGVREFANGSQDVAPNIDTITLEFSTEMNDRHRGFDFGPLGEATALRLQEFLGFAEDKRSLQFTVNLEPGRHYQLQLPDRFLSVDGVPMEPYLIDIKTAER